MALSVADRRVTYAAANQWASARARALHLYVYVRASFGIISHFTYVYAASSLLPHGTSRVRMYNRVELQGHRRSMYQKRRAREHIEAKASIASSSSSCRGSEKKEGKRKPVYKVGVGLLITVAIVACVRPRVFKVLELFLFASAFYCDMSRRREFVRCICGYIDLDVRYLWMRWGERERERVGLLRPMIIVYWLRWGVSGVYRMAWNMNFMRGRGENAAVRSFGV